MVVAAVRGALGFLTSLPVGRTAADWEAFVARPAVISLVGYVVGLLAIVPFLLSLPESVVGFLYVLVLYLVTGINHVDGLLDVADGVATHDDPETAREAMKDSAIGVGAVLTLGLMLLGLYGLGVAVAGFPDGAVGLIVAAEVSAKLGMVAVLARGTAAHEGLGQLLAENADSQSLWVAIGLSIPAALVLWPPHPAAVLAVVSGGTIGLVMARWADGRLGGITGDVVGATNELGRLVALGVGVVAWTLW